MHNKFYFAKATKNYALYAAFKPASASLFIAIITTNICNGMVRYAQVPKSHLRYASPLLFKSSCSTKTDLQPPSAKTIQKCHNCYNQADCDRNV